MLLYIIYIEPLLMVIKKNTSGLMISFVQQVDSDYCVNIVSENENDLAVIDKNFFDFENVSGAILSRSQKTKVMGLGLWKDREIWPLP